MMAALLTGVYKALSDVQKGRATDCDGASW